MRDMRVVSWLVAGIAVLLGTWAFIALQSPPEDQDPPGPNREMPLGYAVTEGAAPGYLPDSACATCHTDLFASYQHVEMAKSFARPRPDVFIENFDAEPYFHPASQRYYDRTTGAARVSVLP